MRETLSFCRVVWTMKAGLREGHGMSKYEIVRRSSVSGAMVAALAVTLVAQTPTPSPATPAPPSRASILRGEYSKYRANNDLLYYHLDIRIDPGQKLVSGKN